MSTNLIVTDAS